MAYPQTGIFALGDGSHGFYELTMKPGTDPAAFVRAIASIHEPRMTIGGVNFVAGFRPDIWRAVAPDETPADVRGFDAPLVGIEGYSMPATQADGWLWIAAASYDRVFDTALGALADLAPVATLARETTGWVYRRNRDLTGFEDGTENPSLMEAPGVALVPPGEPGEAASVLLFQIWRHEPSWEKLSVAAQERAMGRTKLDSVEFDAAQMPENAHVQRASNDIAGDIFRRNMPYGDVREHGTIFVGFCARQEPLDRMLRRMAGTEGGIRDAITLFTTPLTGAYYVIPSVDALARFADDTHD